MSKIKKSQKKLLTGILKKSVYWSIKKKKSEGFFMQAQFRKSGTNKFLKYTDFCV